MTSFVVTLLLLAPTPSVKASRTPVLTYHDIIPNRTKSSVWFDCTVKEFEDQIRWLKARKAVFISTLQLRKALEQKKPLPLNAVCLTFADNYLGFYKYAWPILKREKIPATQFVHTNFVGSPVGRPKMNWQQLLELDQSGLITISSQTSSHPEDLRLLTDQQVTLEFSKSRLLLQTKLRHPVLEIAYPNGKFNSHVSSLARKAGYQIGFTEDCRPAETGKNLWEIPRYVHTKLKQAWKDGIEPLSNARQ